MITIRNQQRKIRVNTTKLRVQAQAMLTILDYADFDLGIWLTTNNTIKHYNKRYRGKNNTTDILSFAYHPALKPENRINAKTDEDKNLGDIIISLEYLKKQAPTWYHTFQQHLTMLLAHGIAHLLGHDHKTDKEYAIMHNLKKKLLNAVKWQG